MNKFKKILALVMSMGVIMTNLPTTALAVGVHEGDTYYEDMQGIPTQDGSYRVESSFYKQLKENPVIDSSSGLISIYKLTIQV